MVNKIYQTTIVKPLLVGYGLIVGSSLAIYSVLLPVDGRFA